MEVAAVGALTHVLLPKLLGVIWAQKHVEEDIKSLLADLKSMDAVLREVEAASPADQLDDDMKQHYDQAIRLTYSIEQCVNKFMARQLWGASVPKMVFDSLKLGIGNTVLGSEFNSDIRTFKREIKKLREWFDDNRVAIFVAVGHPRHTMDADILDGLHIQVKDDLVKKLTADGPTSKGPVKIASVHGPPGVGKTTVAAQVYTQLKQRFQLTAWVTVPTTTNPDIQKIRRSIRRQISQEDAESIGQTDIQAIRHALKDKRYFLVVDNICDKETWDLIKHSLTEDCNGSAVLTTTCSADIAGYVGGGHKLETLNDDYTIKLFNQRFFDSQEICPPELKDISREIACICGGKPLAIIIAASLLKAKPLKEEDWRSVLNFIHTRKFFASYNHLSPNKRSCLLYLSLFQKGYKISVDRLVWGWITEGFVYEQDGLTSQEKGEEYLIELMEKKFIEAVEVDAVGKPLSCRVHDTMHEVIVACSAQQNFVTILDGRQASSMPPSVNHRLSIQGNKINPPLIEERLSPQEKKKEGRLSHVKSLVVSGDGNLLPSLSNFVGLRVFELGGCDSMKDLRGIGSLSRLRCLVMGSNLSSEIPKEIGNLVLLQTLDLSATNVKELPQSVFQIGQLRRLCVNSRTMIPDGIGKMENLEELGDINISKPDLLKKLCNLTKLRVLRIAVWSSDERYGNRLLKYLCSLLQKPKNERKSPRQAIQSLSILTCCSVHFWNMSYSRHPPIDLCLPKLEIRHSKFHSLPRWIFSIEKLTSLSIEVYKISQQIIDMLGKLEHLKSLSLTSTSKRSPDPEGRFGNSPNAFGKLTSFRIVSNAMGVIFLEGAMKYLRRFTISFEASRSKHLSSTSPAFDFGLENLPSSLKHVRVEIICSSASPGMVKEAEDGIREAIKKGGNTVAIFENQRILDEHMVEEEEIEQIAKESPDESSIPVLPDTCVRPNDNKTDEVRSQITQLMIDNMHHQLKLLNHDAKVRDILRDTGLDKDEAHQLVQEAKDRVKDLMIQVLEVECGPSDKSGIVERLYNLGKSNGQHKQQLPTGGNVCHGEGPDAAEAHETSRHSTTVLFALSAKESRNSTTPTEPADARKITTISDKTNTHTPVNETRTQGDNDSPSYDAEPIVRNGDGPGDAEASISAKGKPTPGQAMAAGDEGQTKIASSNMSGDHKDKATCSNSLPEEKENVVWQEGGSQFIRCNENNSNMDDGNRTTSATDFFATGGSGAELADFVATGRELPFAMIVKKYKPRDVLLNIVPAGTSVEEQYGVPVSILEQYHNDNFKKPESAQVSGIMVTFKPEHFHHDSGNCFPVNWEDLYLLMNLREMDASIVRSYTLFNITRVRKDNINAVLVDPHMASRQSMDYNESVVENYMTHVMDLAVEDKKLILWVFNKSFHWILICISTLDGNVYYIDSILRNENRDFEDVKKLIDRSFTAFCSRGKNVEKINYKELTHHMTVPCHQQPIGSMLCGFYAAYHMDLILDDMVNHAQFELPEFGVSPLSEKTLAKLRSQMCSFLVYNVLNNKGEFHTAA